MVLPWNNGKIYVIILNGQEKYVGLIIPIQMTRDMGVNLAKHSIRVNALCPGFAYTNLTKSITDDETVHKKLIELHPMGRLGTAEDIANAALFLASDESSFITGTAIPVDGGYTAR